MSPHHFTIERPPATHPEAPPRLENSHFEAFVSNSVVEVARSVDHDVDADWRSEGSETIVGTLYEYGIYRLKEGNGALVPTTIVGQGPKVSVHVPFVFRAKVPPLAMVFPSCGHWRDSDPHATADLTLTTGLIVNSDWSISASDPQFSVTTTNCADGRYDGLLSAVADAKLKH